MLRRNCAYTSLAVLAVGAGTGVAAGPGLDLAITSLGNLLGLLGLLGGLLLGGTLNLGLGHLDIDLTTAELGFVVGGSSLLGLGQGLVGHEAVSERAGSAGDDVGLQPTLNKEREQQEKRKEASTSVQLQR